MVPPPSPIFKFKFSSRMGRNAHPCFSLGGPCVILKETLMKSFCPSSQGEPVNRTAIQ